MPCTDPDALSLDEIYRRHNADLLRYARRLTRNRVAAEDVAQQAWIKLIGAHRSGTPWPGRDAELRALVFAVARNVFIDGYRRAHFESCTVRLDPHQLDHVAGTDERTGHVPDAAAHRDGVARVLERALSRLPRVQRDAVRLWQLGFDIHTMARRSGVPRDTFLSRKKYALARLRESVLEAGLTADIC
jgi:RNA polymerase sigma-70 factor (ECF subfamily)